MNFYTMKQIKIPLDDSWDIIVLGGGPAGCTAATAAAMEGAKTLLVEATGCLGGMGTSGLVPAWCSFYDYEKMVFGSLTKYVYETLKNATPHHHPDDMRGPIDPERLKRIYDDMVLASGARILLNTFFCSVEMESEGVVSAVLLSNKSGLTAYKAKIYVDCTGDGDLAAWAGAEVMKGDENGDLQPATHCFTLSNVDEYAFRYGTNMHGSNPQSPVYDILKSGRYPAVVDTHFNSHIIGPATVGFNAGHIWNVDNTDPENLTDALIQGRKIAAEIREALAEYVPKAFANSFLVNTGALMGIRETRRIVGDYILNIDDYIARRAFPDEISKGVHHVDIHYSKDEADQHKSGDKTFADWKTKTLDYGKGDSYGVPYRCLTPKGLENVLVAGRCISCDRKVHASVRVMPPCLATGEASGMAAALCVESGNYDVHGVNTDTLRKRLRDKGAYLPEIKDFK